MEKKRQSKWITLQQAASMISSGQSVALGGNLLHRIPAAFARELGRQKLKNLHLLKTAGAYDIDLLCGLGVTNEVSAGFIGYENEFGQCQFYRQAVERNMVKANEHACYSLINALRAASYGVPFLPIRGMMGSDLISVRDFRLVTDPYTSEKLVAIQAIQPDWAIIHVHEADNEGNGKIIGPLFEDVLFTRAAKHVILTADKRVDSFRNLSANDGSIIPSFLVHATVLIPKGAYPASCPSRYDENREELRRFKMLKSREDLTRHLDELERHDRGTILRHV